MVRAGRSLFPSRPGAIHLFVVDPLATHQSRELKAARQTVVGKRGSLVPATSWRRCKPVATTDVRSVPTAWIEAEKPRRCLADGAIKGDRRHSDRLASG